MRILVRLFLVLASVTLATSLSSPDPASAQDAESPAAKMLKEGRVLKKSEHVPPGEADFSLFKLKGRKWQVCAINKDNEAEKAWKTYEVAEVAESSASVVDYASDEKGDAIGERKTNTVDFKKDAAKYRIAPAGKYDVVQFADETVKVKAGVFTCYVVAFVSLAEKEPAFNSIFHISKKYPGLMVISEKSKSRIELTSFMRDAGDKDDANPVAQPRRLPPPPKANWSLYSKKGRQWTIKNSSKLSTTFTTYEITNVAAEHCEYKVTTLDGNKKAIGQPSTLKLEFTEENAAMWVKPLAAYKKVREEKFKAAGVEWDCIVYEGSVLEGQTQTSWMSTKYPGLYVKIVTRQDGLESVSELTEFKE